MFLGNSKENYRVVRSVLIHLFLLLVWMPWEVHSIVLNATDLTYHHIIFFVASICIAVSVRHRRVWR